MPVPVQELAILVLVIEAGDYDKVSLQPLRLCESLVVNLRRRCQQLRRC
jgi:hypothetical protein